MLNAIIMYKFAEMTEQQKKVMYTVISLCFCFYSNAVSKAGQGHKALNLLVSLCNKLHLRTQAVGSDQKNMIRNMRA